MGRESRKEGGIGGGGAGRGRKREKLVLKSTRLNEVTCAGRKGLSQVSHGHFREQHLDDWKCVCEQKIGCGSKIET